MEFCLLCGNLKGALFNHHEPVMAVTSGEAHPLPGAVLRVWQLVCLIYTLVILFVNQQYMKVGVPKGTASFVLEHGETTSHAEPPVYCNNSAYDFTDLEGEPRTNILCRAFERAEIAGREPNGIFISTYVEHRHKTGCSLGVDLDGHYVTALQGKQLDPTSISCDGASRVLPFFVPHIEGVVVKIYHSFIQHEVDIKGYNPQSTLVDQDGEEVVAAEADQPITVSLRQLLAAAGVDSIDARNPDGNATYRVTGLKLQINMVYDNMDGFGQGTEPHTTVKVDIERGTRVEGPGWASFLDVGEEVLTWERQGIEISMLVGGTIGKADFSATMDAIVHVTVLFGVGGVLSSLVVKHFAASYYTKMHAASHIEIEAEERPATKPSSPKPAGSFGAGAKVAPAGAPDAKREDAEVAPPGAAITADGKPAV